MTQIVRSIRGGDEEHPIESAHTADVTLTSVSWNGQALVARFEDSKGGWLMLVPEHEAREILRAAYRHLDAVKAEEEPGRPTARPD